MTTAYWHDSMHNKWRCNITGIEQWNTTSRSNEILEPTKEVIRELGAKLKKGWRDEHFVLSDINRPKNTLKITDNTFHIYDEHNIHLIEVDGEIVYSLFSEPIIRPMMVDLVKTAKEYKQ